MFHEKGTTKLLRDYEEILKREGISERILSICKDVVEKGSYKNAVIASGKIRFLAMACEYDSYWDEKMQHGFREEFFEAEDRVKKNKEGGEKDGK